MAITAGKSFGIYPFGGIKRGIDLVAWSPLGSGFLTGTIEKLGQDDFRQNNPQFNAENLAINRYRFTPFMNLAQELNITPAQLALAWLLHQGKDIFPMPAPGKQRELTKTPVPRRSSSIPQTCNGLTRWCDRAWPKTQH